MDFDRNIIFRRVQMNMMLRQDIIPADDIAHLFQQIENTFFPAFYPEVDIPRLTQRRIGVKPCICRPLEHCSSASHRPKLGGQASGIFIQ